MHAPEEWITPDWPAPVNVRAVVTTRMGGVSEPPFDTFNPVNDVGDTAQAARENRRRLQEYLALDNEPRWLKQVHGRQVVRADKIASGEQADAAWTQQQGLPCVVTTADCLPVFMCDKAGTFVAAIHAGWRGLAQGVVKQCLETVPAVAQDIMTWLGPAIGPQAYEVGEDVYRAFISMDAKFEQAFNVLSTGKWLCDLYAVARLQLSAAGVEEIYGGGFCTHSDKQRFFSFRRDKRCGRMANLIWLERG
ncbi:MAG: peptidoglycan editing factor PgeF [Gammaproteobacteria bacterium]|nr:peptidoglycan editing factor PgeF [Gammaproteobacteria bacterium]